MPYLPTFSFPQADEPYSGGRRMSAIGNQISNLGHKHKPLIDIHLNDSQSNMAVPSYTTLEKIQGEISITCPQDTVYHDIHILLQGSSKTYVEKIATSAPTTPRTQAYHNFLRLTQPMDDMELPEDNIAKANVTYKLPFTFVVPQKLLPQACTHKKDNPQVEDQHLDLPPSFGDPMMASDGKTLLDDLSPNMTVVSYAVRVVMTKPPKNADSRPGALADAMKKLRIVPAYEEQPPLTVGENNEDDYSLSRSKTLKKGMFKGKYGNLTMSANQPAPIRLPYCNVKEVCRVTTMAKVNVRFDPTESKAKPPKLGNLWARLKVATFYATTPLKDFPCKSNAYLYDSQRGIYVDTIPLSSRCVESAQWTKHDAPIRRDSAISISADEPNLNDNLPYYTSQLLVPIDLPTNKSFVPTFHSCLISRVYALDMALSAHSPSSVASTANIHIKLPLQLVSEGNPDARPIISSEEAAHIARREADNEFVPRSVAPPQDESVNHDTHGARGSIFVSPRWGSVSEDEEEPQRRASEPAMYAPRRLSSPVLQSTVPEDDELPPSYSALSGIRTRTGSSQNNQAALQAAVDHGMARSVRMMV